MQIHQDLAKLWGFEVQRAYYQVWYGEGVWYGNGGIGAESILISLILWVYAENFVQIHQDLAKLWRFDVQRAYYIQWRSPIQLLTFYDIHNFYQPQYQCHSGPVVRALAHFSCVLCVMSSNPQWV